MARRSLPAHTNHCTPSSRFPGRHAPRRRAWFNPSHVRSRERRCPLVHALSAVTPRLFFSPPTITLTTLAPLPSCPKPPPTREAAGCSCGVEIRWVVPHLSARRKEIIAIAWLSAAYKVRHGVEIQPLITLATRLSLLGSKLKGTHKTTSVAYRRNHR